MTTTSHVPGVSETAQSSEAPQVKSSPSKPPAYRDELLDHEYDGIREYDNPLPRWWVLTFWGSFVFAVGYFFHYHVSERGFSVAQDYADEMRAVHEQEAKRAMSEGVSEESLAKLAQDETSLKDGKAVFTARCVACHADQGQGLIGPNLTDEYWLHGKGRLMDIYQVVSQGVLDKGMPAWEKQLTPAELRKVAVFVGTLHGKNVAGKAPQGEKAE